MIRLALAALLLASTATAADFDAKSAERFANLALACVHKEYPNKIAHVLNGDQDVQPPRQLTPAFYGCYDWHSSVHGHWLLARVAHVFLEGPAAGPARAALEASLEGARIEAEVRTPDEVFAFLKRQEHARCRMKDFIKKACKSAIACHERPRHGEKSETNGRRLSPKWQ